MKANDPQCIQNLGSTAHFPRWAVAFKFGTPTVQTEVLFQIGRTGGVLTT